MKRSASDSLEIVNKTCYYKGLSILILFLNVFTLKAPFKMLNRFDPVMVNLDSLSGTGNSFNSLDIIGELT